MKQQVLCCLLLTISVGRCHNYGTKGSFSKSFSSSSASASSSAFSSSFSTAGHEGENNVNLLKSGSAAYSSAFANADANGASANSGAYSGSGTHSGSGSGSGVNLKPGSPLLSSGSYSGGSGSYLGTGSFSSSGSYSGTNVKSGHGGSGSGAVTDLSLNGGISGSTNGQGSYAGSGSKGFIPVSIVTANPGNKPGSDATIGLPSKVPVSDSSLSKGNVFINDFHIPDEYSPSLDSPAIAVHNAGSNANSNINSAYIQGSYNTPKVPCCKGPFPGPSGSIHDYKPAPPGGGGPPAWTPAQQNPPSQVPTNPNNIHSGNIGINQGSVHGETIGLSPNLINSFPGPTGSIHDSKPANFDNNPNKHAPNIPVAVLPVAVEVPQYHQNPIQKPIPGSAASTVIGKLPGPIGNIHTSVLVGQNSYLHKDKPTFIPVSVGSVPSPDIINSLPGKPGSIHDNKPVSGSYCTNGQCQPNKPISVEVHRPNTGAILVNTIPAGHIPQYNVNPIYFPDCFKGQCDEFGGRLGCHGNDCFGPGRKPSYSHSGSIAGSNSYVKNENGGISVDLSAPKPVTDILNVNCLDDKCNGNVSPGVNAIKTGPGIIAVGIPTGQVSGYKKHDFNIDNSRKPNLEVFPTPGSINFDLNSPVPDSPGTLCSGIQCILSPVSGSKNLPNQGCSGAYCISLIPEPQGNPNCSGDNCENKKAPSCTGGNCQNAPNYKENFDQPQNNYQQSGNNKNKNVYNSQDKKTFNGYGPSVISVEAETTAGNNENTPKASVTSSPKLEAETPADNKEYAPKPSVTLSPKPEEKKADSSMDFLLPGNKPYHPHHPHKLTQHPFIKPTQELYTEKTPSGGYYSCTGISCPLPKHPGQVTSKPDLPYPTPSYANNKPEQGEPNLCEGQSCTNSQSQLRPFKIPDEYKGAGGRDRIYVPSYNLKEQSPAIVSVLEENVPQIEGDKPYSTADKGFVSGSVIVEKPEGTLVPVVNVQIPSLNKPEQVCSEGKCEGSGYQQGNSGSISGAYSGSLNEQGNNQGCSTGVCNNPTNILPYPDYPERKSDCYNGNCGSNTNENSQGNKQVNGCSSGNCGGSNNGGQSGSYSGTASYGVKGGCKTGSCNLPIAHGGAHSGAYSGANSASFASSSSFSGSNSGSYSSGDNGAGSASYSSAGSGTGFNRGFPLLKELINESIQKGNFHGGASFPASGSYSGSSSYSKGGSSAHSSAYSSSGSYVLK